MQEVNYRCLVDIIQKAAGEHSVDEVTEMCIRLYVLGAAQLTSEWILGKWDATAEDLGMVYEQSFPEQLRKILS